MSYSWRLLHQHRRESVRSPKWDGDIRLLRKIDSCRYHPGCMTPFPQVKKFSQCPTWRYQIPPFSTSFFWSFHFLSFLLLFPYIFFPFISFIFLFLYQFYVFFVSSLSVAFVSLSFLHSFTRVIKSSSAPHKLTLNLPVPVCLSCSYIQKPTCSALSLCVTRSTANISRSFSLPT